MLLVVIGKGRDLEPRNTKMFLLDLYKPYKGRSPISFSASVFMAVLSLEDTPF